MEMVPLTNEYWDRVVSHSVAEIRAGRTPNPDMLCNSRVKFGAFYDYLEKNHGQSFDRVASGHYARVVRAPSAQGHTDTAPAQSSHFEQRAESHQHTSTSGAQGSDEVARLAMTPDAIKDQTYFLAHLSQRQLSRVMFPLGGLTKPQVGQSGTPASQYTTVCRS